MRGYQLVLLYIVCMVLIPISAFAAQETLRVTMIVPLINHSFWLIVQQGAREAASSHDVDVQYVGFDEYDLEGEADMFEIAIAAKVDGIIAVPTDDTQYRRLLRRARVAGIPVVLLDSGVTGDNTRYFVGMDNTQAGYAAGQCMVEATGGHANIGIITGSDTQAGAQERIEGFNAALSDYPDMHIVDMRVSGFDQIKAAQAAADMLLEHPVINAFFGVTGADITGIARMASEKRHRGDFTLIGIDDFDYTMEAIRDGLVCATIARNPFDIGYIGMTQLLHIMSGQEPASDSVYVPFVLVTKENVDSYQEALE